MPAAAACFWWAFPPASMNWPESSLANQLFFQAVIGFVLPLSDVSRSASISSPRHIVLRLVSGGEDLPATVCSLTARRSNMARLVLSTRLKFLRVLATSLELLIIKV